MRVYSIKIISITGIFYLYKIRKNTLLSLNVMPRVEKIISNDFFANRPNPMLFFTKKRIPLFDEKLEKNDREREKKKESKIKFKQKNKFKHFTKKILIN
jgi:hypothetical protein